MKLLQKQRPIADYIPYACHLDTHTLLTKNGEVMQVIKIIGFSYELVGAGQMALRDVVRNAVFAAIPSNEYALWFHTIRRKVSLDPGGEYREFFPHRLNEAWDELHQWNHQYVNELFITVVREGESAQYIKQPQNFLRSLWPPADNRHRWAYLEDSSKALNTVVERMLEELSSFGAQRLGLFRHNGHIYSAPMRFLGKIINLEEEEYLLPTADISMVLAKSLVAFGNNTLEVRRSDRRHYAALLTLKEYRELTVSLLDDFLQLPQEFIVSQCVDFINRDVAMAGYKKQEYAIHLSEDEELAQISGLRMVLDSDQGHPADYGEHQLTIMLLEDSQDALEATVTRTHNLLKKLGIICMREDIRIEDTYWAQLPANFPFATRMKPINTSRVAGFASLYNFPAGRMRGNHWGEAVTVFHTANGTPYFFNFHHEKNGHTAIIGPLGAGKTVLLNFLVSEARKFNIRLFYFDVGRGAEIFIRALGSPYYRVSPERLEDSIALNPFTLPDSKRTYIFLATWIEHLVSTPDAPLDKTARTHVREALQECLKRKKPERSLHVVREHLLMLGADTLAERLQSWLGDGEFAALFDNQEESFEWETIDAVAFGMTRMVKRQELLIPALLYMLHRISLTLDGQKREIIVLDEAWQMLDNPVLAPMLSNWLESLTAYNAVTLFATESAEDASKSVITDALMSHLSTTIFLPNSGLSDIYRTVFRLSEEEYAMMRKLDADARQFLLKHGEDAVVASLDLSKMHDMLYILAGNEESRAIMEEMIAAHGNVPEQWLPAFWERHRSLRQEEEKKNEAPDLLEILGMPRKTLE